jgi:hypothetical protein
MTEIDYERLAKAGHDCPEMERFRGYAWSGVNGWDRTAMIIQARAVVAALADQGFVVVKAGAYELMQSVVETAREIQQAMGERPVDITNETRWELDPVLLNLLAWNMNALDAALAAPGDGETT